MRLRNISDLWVFNNFSVFICSFLNLISRCSVIMCCCRACLLISQSSLAFFVRILAAGTSSSSRPVLLPWHTWLENDVNWRGPDVYDWSCLQSREHWCGDHWYWGHETPEHTGQHYKGCRQHGEGELLVCSHGHSGLQVCNAAHHLLISDDRDFRTNQAQLSQDIRISDDSHSSFQYEDAWLLIFTVWCLHDSLVVLRWFVAFSQQHSLLRMTSSSCLQRLSKKWNTDSTVSDFDHNNNSH